MVDSTTASTSRSTAQRTQRTVPWRYSWTFFATGASGIVIWMPLLALASLGAIGDSTVSLSTVGWLILVAILGGCLANIVSPSDASPFNLSLDALTVINRRIAAIATMVWIALMLLLIVPPLAVVDPIGGALGMLVFTLAVAAGQIAWGRKRRALADGEAFDLVNGDREAESSTSSDAWMERWERMRTWRFVHATARRMGLADNAGATAGGRSASSRSDRECEVAFRTVTVPYESTWALTWIVGWLLIVILGNLFASSGSVIGLVGLPAVMMLLMRPDSSAFGAFNIRRSTVLRIYDPLAVTSVVGGGVAGLLIALTSDGSSHWIVGAILGGVTGLAIAIGQMCGLVFSNVFTFPATFILVLAIFMFSVMLPASWTVNAALLAAAVVALWVVMRLIVMPRLVNSRAVLSPQSRLSRYFGVDADK